MGNSTAAEHYEELKEDVFDNVELQRVRNFDCLLVFDMGTDEEWESPENGQSMYYDYLSLLETEDIETRKRKFPQHAADFYENAAPKVKDFYKFERKLVIKALSKLRMKCERVKAFKSEEADKNIIMYYIGMQEKEARKYAATIGYELQIEPEAAICYLALADEPLAKATVSEEDECKHVYQEAWENVYVKFDNYVAPQIFKPFDVYDEGDSNDGYEDSLFSIRDRCQLIHSCVTSDVEDGGAGIYVPMLQHQNHCIIDFFPLHTLEHLDIILKHLFSWQGCMHCLDLPLEEIRVYFGEYIAIYFAYLQFQTKYFVPIVVFGMALGLVQVGEGLILIPGIAYFALVIVAWAILCPILWTRTEWRLALKWGTLRFDLFERSRPEFKGEYVKSAIHGQREEFYSPHLRNQKRALSLSVVLSFLIALFASVVGIILLRVYVSATGMAYGSIVISVVNALVIMFFNNIYGIIAEKLNSLENYRTETEYENNLILKIFAFRFVNSYAALYYIAFFRPYETPGSGLYCAPATCMATLEQQLAIIFLTQILVSNSIELGELFITRLFAKGHATSYFVPDEKDSLWAQYASPTYERTFDDYNELIISFGYASLFSIAFPWAPMAAFVSNVIEARIDGYKLCKLTRRPFPRQADDIGSWQFAMEVMGWAVLLTNLIMICFTAAALNFTFLHLQDVAFEETLTALILFAILVGFVLTMQYCIATEPREIAQHKDRQDHIERQIDRVGNLIDRYLDGLPDDELLTWRSWNVQQVAFYLREVLYKNPEDYKMLESQLRHRRFGGPAFADADEHAIDKYLGITDPYVQRFILNARAVIIEQEKLALKQQEILRRIDQHLSLQPDEREAKSSGPLFQFTMDHYMQMANFFEHDLTGQSKRRLWQKVDSDMSTVIEKNEMETFLYFSMVVFIKAKFPNVNIPGPKDKTFKTRIIRPLMRWLMHYRITGHGLTFDEFDRYFPIWLREWHKENKQAAAPGGYSKYATIRMESGSDLAASIVEEEEEEDGGKYGRFGKLGDLLGGGPSGTKPAKNKNIKFRNTNSDAGPSDDTIKADLQSGIPISLNVDSSRVARLRQEMGRNGWPPESEEWEAKLDDLADAIERTDNRLRLKIWNKVAKDGKDSLDSEKSLEKLLFSFIALYIKTKDRSQKPPRYANLRPLLTELSSEIRAMLDGDTNFIERDDFLKNIASYMSRVAAIQRRKAAVAAGKDASLNDSASSYVNRGKKPKPKEKRGWFG
jgi:predicted transcriptional regulator YdeE